MWLLLINLARLTVELLLTTTHVCSYSGLADYRPPVRDNVELREYRGARDFDDRRGFPSQRPGPYADMLDHPVTRDYGRPVSRDYPPPGTARRYSPEMRLATLVWKVALSFDFHAFGQHAGSIMLLTPRLAY